MVSSITSILVLLPDTIYCGQWSYIAKRIQSILFDCSSRTICGTLYFKFNGIYAINIIIIPGIIEWKDIIYMYIAEHKIKAPHYPDSIFSFEVPSWNLLHSNKWTSRRKRNTVHTHSDTYCLLEVDPPNFTNTQMYITKKIKNLIFYDVRFRKRFVRTRVYLQDIIVSS